MRHLSVGFVFILPSLWRYARFGGLVRLCIAADKFLYRQSIGVLNYHKTFPALLSN